MRCQIICCQAKLSKQIIKLYLLNNLRAIFITAGTVLFRRFLFYSYYFFYTHRTTIKLIKIINIILSDITIMVFNLYNYNYYLLIEFKPFNYHAFSQ